MLKIVHLDPVDVGCRERCAMCHRFTWGWYEPKDVAMCDDCAATTEPDAVPTKLVWWNAVNAKFPSTSPAHRHHDLIASLPSWNRPPDTARLETAATLALETLAYCTLPGPGCDDAATIKIAIRYLCEALGKPLPEPLAAIDLELSEPRPFTPDEPFYIACDPQACIDDFRVRGAGWGALVHWSDGSSGMVYWTHSGKSQSGHAAHDLVQGMPRTIDTKSH